MKATGEQKRRRVEEVLRIRLDGAEIWDVREYVREKEQEKGSPWESPPDGKPLSDSQLWRYMAAADKLIAESCRASRKKLIRRHLAQRRNLFAKAVSAGDYRTALAVAKDEAELQGLYPSGKLQLTGKDGKDLIPAPARVLTDEQFRQLSDEEQSRYLRKQLPLRLAEQEAPKPDA